MSVLTALGLLLDLMGAVLITISDPLRFPSLILRTRYWFDRNFGPVVFVKEGYEQARAGDVYKSEERQLDEQAEGEPESIEEVLATVNRLERTEVNPELVERLYQIALLTEDGEQPLLRDEYRPPVWINSGYVLYKITFTPKHETDFDDAAISFVHYPDGVQKKVRGDEDHVYSVPEKDFREKLSEYINGVYLRNGMYLLMAGFALQILDILLTAVVGRL